MTKVNVLEMYKEIIDELVLLHIQDTALAFLNYQLQLDS